MSHPFLNWKRCKKCGEIFDIGTNFDICPKCRRNMETVERILGGDRK